MTKKKAIIYSIIFVVLFCASLIFRAYVLYDPSKEFNENCKNVFAPSCQMYVKDITAQKKYDEAIQAIEKTLSLKKLNPSWIASSYSKLASIYFYWKKDLAKANEYIKKADTVPGATWGKNPALAKAIQKALDAANK